jgi:hypothetical protein
MVWLHLSAIRVGGGGILLSHGACFLPALPWCWCWGWGVGGNLTPQQAGALRNFATHSQLKGQCHQFSTSGFFPQAPEYTISVISVPVAKFATGVVATDIVDTGGAP